MQKSYQYLIVGGGSGGLTVAARLRKKLKNQTIAVIEPNTKHYYQPIWTLVGAGICHFDTSVRAQKNLIPKGVDWINTKVEKIDPNKHEVFCENGDIIHYEFLVVATGLETRFDLIPGSEAIGSNGLCSIYHQPTVAHTSDMLREFKGGNAIFTMPPVPIKCAGAPQKIMYLADEIFRNNKVRDKTKITYAAAGKVIFGVPEFARALTEVALRKEIKTLFSHRLVKIDSKERLAYFEKSTETNDNGTIRIETEITPLSYDLLHVVPPMTAHQLIRASGLAFETGPQKDWLKVDPFTLQHTEYKNIFGIGDVTGVPNSKTLAAIRKQTPVVVANLLAVANGQTPSAQYNGYSACPLVTGVGKVILAEFGYDGKLMPSFPFEMTKELWSMWLLKRYFFPKLYWQGMLKARA